MKQFNKYILEAINRGVQLALDDYEDDNQLSSKQNIVNDVHFGEYIKFTHNIEILLTDDYLSAPTKLDQIRVFKEIVRLHDEYGFKYKVEDLKDLKFIIEKIISIWCTTTNNFNWVDVSGLTSLQYAFSIPSIREEIGNVVIDEWDVSNVTDMTFMAWNCVHFKADLSKWNVCNVKYAAGAFLNCREFNSDLSKWNVSKLEDASQMFLHCESFESDLSKWDVKNLVRCDRMFCNASFFKSDLSKWNLENILNGELCRQMFDNTMMAKARSLYPPKYFYFQKE